MSVRWHAGQSRQPSGVSPSLISTAPAPKGDFNLTMRLYGSETPVLDGSYRLPPVRRME
jgi:hypothetical protein